MSTLEDAKRKAATTYNAASDLYDHPANTFWERYGRRTVERLRLAPGARVLDVCCGSGASAIPAAEIVGPNGLVELLVIYHLTFIIGHLAGYQLEPPLITK